jgi:D-cysteine desulfhydrase family pyridoxal phosphate-dependent enzyme
LGLDLSDRISLCTLPTPLHKLEELSRRLSRDIWIKRDDLTGFAMGGNKARKAEFLLADALQKHCDVILTAGAMQSNHARIIATASRKLSLECHLFLAGQKTDPPTSNVLLDLLADACIHMVKSKEDRVSAMEAFSKKLKKDKRTPYIIPVGGSNEVGAQGYVSGFEELDGQLHNLSSKSTVLVFCSSSGGTHAGILVGKAMSRSQVKILGIRNDDDPNLEESICSVANALVKRLGLNREFHRQDVHLNSNYVGEGYGVPSEEGREAIRELWQREGILLDPVYTAKAMAALIDLARIGEWSNERIVFLHTGGIPPIQSLF